MDVDSDKDLPDVSHHCERHSVNAMKQAGAYHKILITPIDPDSPIPYPPSMLRSSWSSTTATQRPIRW